MNSYAEKRAVSSRLIQVQDQRVQLLRKRIKNLNLSVRAPQGQVRVSAPMRVSEREVRRFVESRLDWIRKQQARLSRQSQATAFEYLSGERHPFLGRDYVLSVQQAASSRVILNGDGRLHMFLQGAVDVGERQQLLETWYRQQLKGLIPGLIKQYEPIMGVQVAEWRIRKMKTRWGTCNIHKRRIWINLELAKLPLICLESIVVHEMTHLLERGHNARFYALMDRFMPDWRQSQDILRDYVIAG